jgi:serine/threonine protein kinase
MLAAGERLGSYLIESLVGRGGMGEVYLAYDERLQRPVAIKRIRQDRFDPEHRERFRREALALAQVSAYFEAAARSLRRLRQVVSRHGGLEVEKGDAFLALFERPADAVACALEHWQAVAELAGSTGQPLAAGAVVHFGEVVLRRSTPQEIARGARVIEVEGGAKALAAQIGSVLSPGQILLTRAAFDLARQGAAAAGSWTSRPAQPPAAAPDQLRWLAHGIYLFEGDEDPVEIFEVGLAGRSPLAAPKDSSRARRVLSPNEEKMLGWRPAREQQIPFRSSWTLAERIGDGGFGEVWLARHASGERRVFKFCWEASRLRALKREVTLLGILRDALGNREDIARIFDWQFEQAPYFLELEYSAGGSLPSWSEAAGGLTGLPLLDRLELGAQVAEAVAAAHSVGVLHKDIKPANVLVVQGADGRPRIKLADFGLGLLERGELADLRGKSPYGFSFAFSEADSGAGTLGYLAPELVEGKAATVQADIYSLGVLVYQLAVGDFKRTLAPGWERGIADELLREDLASFVDGQPERRPASAREVAGLLRGLDERRERRRAERRQEDLAAASEPALAKAQRRRRWATAAAALALLVLAVVAVLALQAQRAGAKARLEAAKSEQVADFLSGLFVDLDPLESLGGKASARDLLDGGAARLAELAGQPEVKARLEDAIGRAYWSLGEYETAMGLAQRAAATHERLLGRDALETARSRHLVGQVRCSLTCTRRSRSAEPGRWTGRTIRPRSCTACRLPAWPGKASGRKRWRSSSGRSRGSKKGCRTRRRRKRRKAG